MSSSLHKLIWIVVHLLANLITKLYLIGIQFRDLSSHFFKNRQNNNSNNEKRMIECSINEIKKVPQHLAVMLDLENEKPDLQTLTNLVFWSLNCGINYISFYDYEGVLKNEYSVSFLDHIEQQKDQNDDENIVWGPQYNQTTNIRFPHKNGYKKHIVVNLYSADDCKAKFNQLLKTQELCLTNITSTDKNNIKGLTKDDDNVLIELIDNKLKEVFGNWPDPELAVYFGNICTTNGFMPWQIRLTEFIKINHHQHHLPLHKFLRVLYRFAKCEQRFGK